MIVEGITAALFLFRIEIETAVFAFIARQMKTSIESDDADRPALLRLQHYRLSANTTSRGELSMKIFDAVNPIGRVDGERDPVETLPADDAAETGGMVRFAGRPKDPIEDRFRTHRTLLEGVQIVLFAVRLSVQGVERFTLQIDGAPSADETFNVINSLHGGAAGALSQDFLSAFRAGPVRLGLPAVSRLSSSVPHGPDEQVGQRVHLRLSPLGLRGSPVHRVLGPRGHLTRRSRVDRLVKRLVGRGSLRSAVTGVLRRERGGRPVRGVCRSPQLAVTRRHRRRGRRHLLRGRRLGLGTARVRDVSVHVIGPAGREQVAVYQGVAAPHVYVRPVRGAPSVQVAVHRRSLLILMMIVGRGRIRRQQADGIGGLADGLDRVALGDQRLVLALVLLVLGLRFGRDGRRQSGGRGRGRHLRLGLRLSGLTDHHLVEQVELVEMPVNVNGVRVRVQPGGGPGGRGVSLALDTVPRAHVAVRARARVQVRVPVGFLVLVWSCA